MNEEATKKQSWIQLLSIQTSAAICIPNILVGQLLSHKHGWRGAILAIILGNFFLLLASYLFAILSTRNRQTTACQAAHYFGNRGNLFFGCLIMLAMLLWFGIQLDVISAAFEPLGQNAFLLTLSIAAIIILSSMKGMKAIKWLSYCTSPLLLLTILIASYFTPPSSPLPTPFSLSCFQGLSLIIGTNIIGAIDFPTYFQHATSGKDAKICILLLFGLLVPLVQVMGVYLAAVSNTSSVIAALQSSMGPIWMIWVSIFVFLSGWSINHLNLYSALAASYSLPTNLSPQKRILILGAIGTTVFCFNPLHNIEFTLELIAILIGAMGAVILSNFLSSSQDSRYRFSIFSWAVGVSVGCFSSFFSFFITGSPVFDAFLTSFALQSAINLALSSRQKKPSNT